MSAKLRLIPVLLSCLLISCGMISRLHHHTEGDGICFCMDHDGDDFCCRHHDSDHTHGDSGDCPYKIVAFKHSAANDLTLIPLIISSFIFNQAEDASPGRHDFAAYIYGHSSEILRSPDMTVSGLRAPPCMTAL